MTLTEARARNTLQAARTNFFLFIDQVRCRSGLPPILMLGLVLGLVCVAVITPWWHYDEPGHFEYVWLAAHSPHWPVPGQYDMTMRRELGASLYQYHWYEIRNMAPDPKSATPMPIGVLQVGDQPGYYFLASLPLRLIPHAPLMVQYYAARLVSLALFLLVIVVVWYALGEILPGAHPLRWMGTVFVALLPAFVDTMAAVNNDVSAVLAASLFLWASFRLIQKGYSLRNVLLLVASLLACFLSKSTSWFCFILTPVTLLLALLRGRLLAFFYIGAAIFLLAVAVLTLKWGVPAAWYLKTTSDATGRVQAKGTPLGSHAFVLDNGGLAASNQLLQIIPPNQVKALRGKAVTLGAWMWASQDTQAGPLTIRVRGTSGTFDSSQTPIQLTTTPTYYTVVFRVPSDAANGNIYVQEGGQGSVHNKIFLDGMVLAVGEFTAATPPHFTDSSANRGSWGGQRFENIIRNGSAEQGSILVRSWLNNRVAGFLTAKAHMSIPLILMTAQDWKGSSWYYRGVAGTLFRTFWASLAGDKAFLRGQFISGFLVLLTIAGLVGAVILVWRHRRTLHWDIIGQLGLALLIPWVFAFTRGSASLGNPVSPLFPWARYAYPAILPTALLLCGGWLEWLDLLGTRFNLTPATRNAIFLSMMIGLSVFAVLNAIQILHPAWWDSWIMLLLLLLSQYVIFHWVIRWPARGLEQPPSSGAGTA